MSKQITIHQHYVPKMYLKHFGVRLQSKRPLYSCFVYDKKIQKSEKKHIDEICFKDYLYEYPAWTLRTDINKIENWLNHIESKQAPLLDNFLLNPSKYLCDHVFEKKHRKMLVELALSLFLRSPDSLEQAPIAAKQIGINVPETQHGSFGLDLLLQNFSAFCQGIYRTYNITIMHNHTSMPFLTSDKPTTQIIPMQKSKNYHWRTYCLALSPEYVLLIFPKIECFTTKTPELFDACDNIVECNDIFVILHNLAHINSHHKYVIAPTNEQLNKGMSASFYINDVQQCINNIKEICDS